MNEDYVSFETAKLLKEKGFDEDCRAFWKEWDGQAVLYHCGSNHVFEWCHNSMLEEYNDEEELNVAAPTLQMAMKWLREVRHYYIQVMLDRRHMGYYVIIHKTDSDFEIRLSDAIDKDFYQTYEEACETAIKYCLLIFYIKIQ